MTTRLPPVHAGARLSDQVACSLADEIRAGHRVPGERLPTEAELVVAFGVSRTVVREAVSRLKSLGLVVSRQGSGTTVAARAAFAPLNFDSGPAGSQAAVLQIVEVRRALEAEAAELAADRRTEPGIRAMRDALAAIDAAVSRGEDGVEEDLRFHRAIADAAGNGYLGATLDFLAQYHRNATRVTRANEARRTDFAAAVRREHQAVLRAIEAGDAARARRAAAQHLRNAARRIEAADPDFWRQEGARLARPLVEDPPRAASGRASTKP